MYFIFCVLGRKRNYRLEKLLVMYIKYSLCVYCYLIERKYNFK